MTAIKARRSYVGRVLHVALIVSIWALIGFNMTMRVLPVRHITVRYINCPTLAKAAP